MIVKMTKIFPNQGAIFSMSTAIFVWITDIGGFPVFTTNVSVGAIYGVSLQTKINDNKVFSDIVKSLVLKMPLVIIIESGFYIILSNSLKQEI